MKKRLRPLNSFPWSLALVGMVFWGCAGNPDALDADVQQVSQSGDLGTLTYVVRVKSTGTCDALGVEVDVRIPISLTSTVQPGETLERTHRVGRVQRDKRKKKTFIIDTAGALIETDSISAEVSDVDGLEACQVF